MCLMVTDGNKLQLNNCYSRCTPASLSSPQQVPPDSSQDIGETGGAACCCGTLLAKESADDAAEVGSAVES